MKHVFLSIMLLIFATSSFSREDRLIGTWHTPMVNGGTIKITVEDKLYKVYMASTDSMISNVGELIAVFTYQKHTRKYVGSHKWGGRKKGKIFWGKPGGMDVRIINRNKLFIAYNDSRYKDGWIYKRVKH